MSNTNPLSRTPDAAEEFDSYAVDAPEAGLDADLFEDDAVDDDGDVEVDADLLDDDDDLDGDLDGDDLDDDLDDHLDDDDLDGDLLIEDEDDDLLDDEDDPL